MGAYQVLLFGVLPLLIASDEIPPVEGDVDFIEIVKAARREHISQFASGEMSVSIENSHKSKFAIDIVWSGNKTYWQQVERPWDYEKKQPFPPVISRAFCDGKQCGRYISSDSGGVLVLLSIDKARSSSWYPRLQLQPAILWNVVYPNGRAWDEMLGYHPKFPSKDVIKWVVRRTNDDELRFERYDASGGKFFASASLKTGLVLHDKYESKSQNSETKYTISTDERGRAYYSQIDHRQKERQFWEKVNVTRFIPLDSVPKQKFTIAALDVANGAQVKDLIANRNYVYTSSSLNQKTLDEQAETLKKRRNNIAPKVP